MIRFIRLLINCLLVLFTSLAVAILAVNGLGSPISSGAVALFVNLLDLFSIPAALISIITLKLYQKPLECLITIIPSLSLIVSFILIMLNYTIPSPLYIVYDFFIIYWFGYLIVYDLLIKPSAH